MSGRPASLLGELVQVGKNNGMEFHVKTTSSLTRRIKENTTMLKSQKIIFRVDHGENGTEWQFKLYKKEIPKDPSDVSVPSGQTKFEHVSTPEKS